MSFLAKAVLGQRVVHPLPSHPMTVAEEHLAASPMRVPLQETNSTDSALTPSQNVPLRNPFGSPMGRALPNGGTTGASPSPPQPPRSKTPVRTLIMRLLTCVVVQDMRDCLSEMVGCNDLPYVMAPREVIHLVNLVKEHADDDSITASTLSILANMTDLQTYPSDASISDREKRSIRDGFVHEMLVEGQLFIEELKRPGVAFWSRFHCVQILQRLQERDPAVTHKLLLNSHGLTVLVGLLSDRSNDGMLRKEVLTLLAAVTSMDTELQTILAFEGGFDALFGVIAEEGGVNGGSIASESLTVILNMVRGNRATQKLFLEMGCAKYLCPLFLAVPLTLDERRNPKRNNDDSSGVPTTAAGEGGKITDMQNIILMSVSILSHIIEKLKPADEVTRLREALVDGEVVQPLTALALCGVAIGDCVRIEALRVLAALVNQCRPAIHAFLGMVVLTLVQVDFPRRVCRWTSLRALWEYMFTTDDTTMSLACAQLISALWSVQECLTTVSDAVLLNFAPSAVPGMRSMKHYSLVESGEALSCALMGPAPTAAGKYYAAHVLLLTFGISGVPDRLFDIIWSSESQRSPLLPKAEVTPMYLPNNAMVPMSTSLAPTFFNAYVSYCMFCLVGGNSSENVDSATLGVYVRLLITWLRQSPKALRQFLHHPQWYRTLLKQAGKPGHVNGRLWCAAIAATVCVDAPREVSRPPHNTNAVWDRHQLFELFVDQLGGPAFIDNIIFDVNASTPQWSVPAANALTSSSPALYDEAFVSLLVEVFREFSAACPPRQAACPMGTESIIPLPAPLPQQPDRPSQNSELVGKTSAFPSRSTEPGATMLDKQRIEAVETELAEVRRQLRHCEEANANLGQENAQLLAELAVAQAAPRTAVTEAMSTLQSVESSYQGQIKVLQENIELLQDALCSKEEEIEQLLQSLSMMEAQLNPSNGSGAASQFVASVPSPASDLHRVEGDADGLKHLNAVTEDCHDLLLLVGALDMECESLRVSAVPTPAKPLYLVEDAAPPPNLETVMHLSSDLPPLYEATDVHLISAQAALADAAQATHDQQVGEYQQLPVLQPSLYNSLVTHQAHSLPQETSPSVTEDLLLYRKPTEVSAVTPGDHPLSILCCDSAKPFSAADGDEDFHVGTAMIHESTPLRTSVSAGEQDRTNSFTALAVASSASVHPSSSPFATVGDSVCDSTVNGSHVATPAPLPLSCTSAWEANEEHLVPVSKRASFSNPTEALEAIHNPFAVAGNAPFSEDHDDFDLK